MFLIFFTGGYKAIKMKENSYLLTFELKKNLVEGCIRGKNRIVCCCGVVADRHYADEISYCIYNDRGKGNMRSCI